MSAENHSSSPFFQTFGERMGTYRRREGVEVNKVGQTLGVSSYAMSNIESGKNAPPSSAIFYERMRFLPNFTKSDLHYMLGGKDVPSNFELKGIPLEYVVEALEPQPSIIDSSQIPQVKKTD